MAALIVVSFTLRQLQRIMACLPTPTRWYAPCRGTSHGARQAMTLIRGGIAGEGTVRGAILVG